MKLHNRPFNANTTWKMNCLKLGTEQLAIRKYSALLLPLQLNCLGTTTLLCWNRVPSHFSAMPRKFGGLCSNAIHRKIIFLNRKVVRSLSSWVQRHITILLAFILLIGPCKVHIYWFVVLFGVCANEFLIYCFSFVHQEFQFQEWTCLHQIEYTPGRMIEKGCQSEETWGRKWGTFELKNLSKTEIFTRILASVQVFMRTAYSS